VLGGQEARDHVGLAIGPGAQQKRLGPELVHSMSCNRAVVRLTTAGLILTSGLGSGAMPSCILIPRTRSNEKTLRPR